MLHTGEPHSNAIHVKRVEKLALYPCPTFYAAAKILKTREAELPGTVVLLFQPAEEGPGGAAVMIAEGELQGIVGAAGLHVWPQTPSGVFTSRVRSNRRNPQMRF